MGFEVRRKNGRGGRAAKYSPAVVQFPPVPTERLAPRSCLHRSQAHRHSQPRMCCSALYLKRLEALSNSANALAPWATRHSKKVSRIRDMRSVHKVWEAAFTRGRAAVPMPLCTQEATSISWSAISVHERLCPRLSG